MKSGYTSMSGDSRVSRTMPRIAADRRSRRGRLTRSSDTWGLLAMGARLLAAEVFDERIHEIGDCVPPGHDGRRDAELLTGFGRDRPDRGDDRAAQQVRRLFGAVKDRKSVV